MKEIQDKLHARVVRLSILTLVVAGVSIWSLSNQFGRTLEIIGTSGLVFDPQFAVSAISLFAVVAAVAWILTQSTSDMNQVKRMAFVDELTGLPNRRSFNSRLEEELIESYQQNKQIAVFYFDLDRFKIINDCHGHEAGDTVIKVFGERISNAVRNDDMVARLAGDEFAAIVKNINDGDCLNKVSVRVLEAMKQPITFQGKNLYVGTSIGVYLSDNELLDSVEALRRADFALLHAKESGRNKMVLFCPQMADEIKSKSELGSELRDAIINHRLEMRYQPLVNQNDGKIMGVEALVRWTNGERGVIAPDIFIPLAEEIGIMDELGSFVLRRACMDIKPLGDIKLAVNVSPMQFLQDGFIDMVQDILMETGFEPSRLELEITEGVLISTPDAAAEVLAKLRFLGVRIALDDFGTGFSSMSYLRAYPLDRIKIDRSFIEGINCDDNSYEFVSKMIELGSSLGMKVTVEGIETEQQLQLMQNSQCSELQGFYFSKPLTSTELLESDLIHSRAQDPVAKNNLRLVS